jgi:ABC-type branched-subunit amino acid transport system ATPase component/branched-subunit amino acid ABC-type transport system permease component
MMTVLGFAILGLAAGAIYGITAFGTILVYRGSGVVNFAAGALATVATFVYYDLTQDHVAWPLAMAIGTIVSGVLGAATYLLIMKPMSKSSTLTRTIATLGVFVTANAALLMWEPSNQIIVPSFYPQGAWRFARYMALGYDSITVLVIGVVLAVLLATLWGRTKFGLKTSAVAENQRSASSLGISSDLVATVNWFLGCALSALAGILLLPILGLQTATITNLLFPSLAAALIGRMKSFPLALVGGLGIGIGESIVTGYWPSTPGLTVIVPFAGVLLLMLIRGQGIPNRGYLRDRLPEVGTGRIRPAYLFIGSAVILVLIWSFGANYADAMITTVGTAIVLLSLVVVTGYAGQISLCQFSMAGIGALVMGQLFATEHMPLLLCVIIAIATAVTGGVIVGVPALRSRGVSLAVLTLGFAVALQQVIFDNSSAAGFGDKIGTLSIFGLKLDSTTDPARYATFALVVFLLLALLVAKVRRGVIGRRLLAVRGSERAAAALGINVYAAKLFAFSLGAGIAAVGGIVLIFRSPIAVYGTQYDYPESINALIYSVIGGLGYLSGPMLAAAAAVPGALVYQLLNFLRQANDQLLTFIGGFGLILVLWTAPDGLAKQNADAFKLASQFVKKRLGAGGDGSGAAHHLTYSSDAPVLFAGEVAKVPSKVLEISEVSVQFGGVVALDGVSLDLIPGEVLGLIGPNGAGKTTLLDAITGFVRISKGTIRLDGQQLDRLSVFRRANSGIGRSFQSLELFDDLTVRENLQVACDATAGGYLSNLVLPRRSKLSPNAQEIVALFQLGDQLERKVRELSYGARRLCAIARAAAANPSVLLLDEPAAGLGEGEVAEVRRLVVDLAKRKGVAVLLIEHNIDLIMEICDRVIVLDFGKEIARGRPDEVRFDPRVLEAYMGETPSPDTLVAVAAEETIRGT